MKVENLAERRLKERRELERTHPDFDYDMLCEDAECKELLGNPHTCLEAIYSIYLEKQNEGALKYGSQITELPCNVVEHKKNTDSSESCRIRFCPVCGERIENSCSSCISCGHIFRLKPDNNSLQRSSSTISVQNTSFQSLAELHLNNSQSSQIETNPPKVTVKSKALFEDKNNIYCLHCGKEINSDSIFCRFCGQTQKQKSPKPKKPRNILLPIRQQFRDIRNCMTKLNKKSRVVLGSCFCAVIVLSIVLFFALGGCIHKYVKGQCIRCEKIDGEYCASKYFDMNIAINNITDHPQSAFNDIHNYLDDLPSDYQDVAELKLQVDYVEENVMYLYNACRSSNPNYHKIQRVYIDLYSKKNAYAKWNIEEILSHYLSYRKIVYGVLLGEWENGSTYFRLTVSDSDSFTLSSNLPSNKISLFSYTFQLEDRIISYQNKLIETDSFKAYKITQVTNSYISVYCFKNSKTYKLYNDNLPEPSKDDYFIGNKNSKIFHIPTCKFLPDSENRRYYESAWDAYADGYRPCGHCAP